MLCSNELCISTTCYFAANTGVKHHHHHAYNACIIIGRRHYGITDGNDVLQHGTLMTLTSSFPLRTRLHVKPNWAVWCDNNRCQLLHAFFSLRIR